MQQSNNHIDTNNYSIYPSVINILEKTHSNENDISSTELTTESTNEISTQDTISKLIDVANFKILDQIQIINHIENIQELEESKQKITNEHVLNSINQQIDGIKFSLLKHKYIFKSADIGALILEAHLEIKKLKVEVGNLEQDLKKCQNEKSELQQTYSVVLKDAQTFFHEKRKLQLLIDQCILDANKFKDNASQLRKDNQDLVKKLKIQEANAELKQEAGDIERKELKRKNEQLENQYESATKKLKLKNDRLKSLFQKEAEKNQALMDLCNKFQTNFATVKDPITKELK